MLSLVVKGRRGYVYVTSFPQRATGPTSLVRWEKLFLYMSDVFFWHTVIVYHGQGCSVIAVSAIWPWNKVYGCNTGHIDKWLWRKFHVVLALKKILLLGDESYGDNSYTQNRKIIIKKKQWSKCLLGFLQMCSDAKCMCDHCLILQCY